MLSCTNFKIYSYIFTAYIVPDTFMNFCLKIMQLVKVLELLPEMYFVDILKFATTKIFGLYYNNTELYKL